MSALRIAGYVTLLVAGCCGLSLGSYAVARRVLLARADAQTHHLAGVVIATIATLPRLLLALVFAQALLNVNEARETMPREASLPGNVYDDLARYGGHETASARAALVAGEWCDATRFFVHCYDHKPASWFDYDEAADARRQPWQTP